MDKLVNFIEVKLAPPLIKLSQNRYLDSVQKAFMSFMPYLLISSFFLLFTSLPIPGWKEVVAPLAPLFGRMINGTLGIIAVGISVLLGYHLGAYYNKIDVRVSKVSTAVLSLVCFLLLFPITVTEDGATVMNAAYFGSTGIFSALIVTIISVEIYRLVIKKNLVIKMPEQVPPMVTQSFMAIIPAFITLVFWFLVIIVGQLDLPGLVDKAFAPILMAGSSSLAQFIAFMLDRILWFVGIHGSNVVGSVMSPVWTQMITENIDAFANNITPPYLFTNVWLEYTVRVSLVPLVVLMVFSKVKRYKTLGKMALLPAVFNIAEPIMFGLPLVLNPILFIPWVLGYAVVFGVSYVFTGILHLVPPMVATVPWTIPGPIAAFLGSNGNIWATLVSCLNLILMFLIWWPFFKVLEKQELVSEQEQEATIIEENKDKITNEQLHPIK